jgi:rsbT co-antagonist protein RsbR
MSRETYEKILSLLKQDEAQLLSAWIDEQTSSNTARRDLLSGAELRDQSNDFLRLLREGLESGGMENIQAAPWTETREALSRICRSRAAQGFSPSETAMFVFSLKGPLFSLIRQAHSDNPQILADDTWAVSTLIDKFGLLTTEVYQKSREEIISRQQQEMLELSTPVVKLWEGVLALPLIGTLDSARTQIVMESLLQMIVDTGSNIAIIDITGVSTVDTLVAQHLLKTVTAARLMGAECIISGIRPQIAQTIVHLGVDLSGVVTRASMADALSLALKRGGFLISKNSAA